MSDVTVVLVVAVGWTVSAFALGLLLGRACALNNTEDDRRGR